MRDERARLVSRARRSALEIEQLFADTEHWNRTHPDEEPIDPDPDGKLGGMLNSLTSTLRSEDIQLVDGSET